MYKNAVRLNPNHNLALANAGVLIDYHATSDSKMYYDGYFFTRRAVLLDDTHSLHLNNIAASLWEDLQRHKVALQFYRKCLKIDPLQEFAVEYYPKSERDFEQKTSMVSVYQL